MRTGPTVLPSPPQLVQDHLCFCSWGLKAPTHCSFRWESGTMRFIH